MPINGSFEEEYKTTKSYWGDSPSSVIRKYATSLKQGSILDVGAGDGRNALFLANKGYAVYALDVSETGLLNISEKVADNKFPAITTIVANFVTYKPSIQYDNIITNFTIHFVGSRNIAVFIEKMIHATKPGGINIIDDFTQNGPLATNPENFVTPELLENIYKGYGWDILLNEQRIVETKAFESPGKHLNHEAVAFIARKPLL